MLSSWILFVLCTSSAIGIGIPPEWREVIQNLCSETNHPPCSLQICYGRHDDQMQVSIDSQNCIDTFMLALLLGFAVHCSSSAFVVTF